MNSNFIRVYKFLMITVLSICVEPYRLGDTVDTIAGVGQEVNPIKMSEMPNFGQPSVVSFKRRKGLLSFGFEDGLHMLPWIDTTDLERLVITFVFSKSGEGAIESVSINALRGQSNSDEFLVEYKWIEEIPAEPQAGACAMLLGSLISCIVVLLRVCVSSDNEETPTDVSPATRQLRGHED